MKPSYLEKSLQVSEFRSAPNGDQGFKRCWGVDGSEPMIIDIYGAASAELSARIGQLSASGQVGLQHLSDADIEEPRKPIASDSASLPRLERMVKCSTPRVLEN